MTDETQTEGSEPKRLHHWLVSGKVIFLSSPQPGEEPQAGNFEHNTIITNTLQFVTANMIGQAQQALQMELFNQLPDPAMQIVNVHIQGVHYLGDMTKEQFYTPPPAEAVSGGKQPSPVNDRSDPFRIH